MIDQRLLQYLEESLKAGYSLEQTKNTLLNNGFSASIVDEATRKDMSMLAFGIDYPLVFGI